MALVVEEKQPDNEGSNLMFYFVFISLGFLLFGFVYRIRERQRKEESEQDETSEDWNDEDNEIGNSDTENYEPENNETEDNNTEEIVRSPSHDPSGFMPSEESEQPSPKPQEQPTVCPNCLSGITFIPPLKKWYCHVCKEFVNPEE